MDLLQKYLNKIGVSSFEDLNREEKDTIKQWEDALRGRKITDEDVMIWLNTRKNDVIAKLTNTELSNKADTFLKMELNFIINLEGFINGPAIEKEIMQRNIEKLL